MKRLTPGMIAPAYGKGDFRFVKYGEYSDFTLIWESVGGDLRTEITDPTGHNFNGKPIVQVDYAK